MVTKHPRLVEMANELVHWRSEQFRAKQEVRRVTAEAVACEVLLKDAMVDEGVDVFALNKNQVLVWVDDTDEIEIVDKPY